MTLADYPRVGRLLGRLAGRFPESPDAARLPLPLRHRDLRQYFFGRVSHGVLPALRGDAVWEHPLVAPVVDADLRRDLHDRRARFARFLIDLARARFSLDHPRDAAV